MADSFILVEDSWATHFGPEVGCLTESQRGWPDISYGAKVGNTLWPRSRLAGRERLALLFLVEQRWATQLGSDIGRQGERGWPH